MLCGHCANLQLKQSEFNYCSQSQRTEQLVRSEIKHYDWMLHVMWQIFNPLECIISGCSSWLLYHDFLTLPPDFYVTKKNWAISKILCKKRPEMAHFKKEFKACNLRYLFKMNWHQGSFIKNVFVKALNFSIRNTYDPIDTIFLHRIATAI